MDSVGVESVIGIVAGLCTTASFVPQLVKAWKGEDTEGVSKRMYALSVSAFVLWIIYGAMIGSMVLLIFNLTGLLLSAAILVLRLRARRRAAASPPSSAGTRA